MATVAQIKSFVNDIAEEALGEKAIRVKTTTDLVSLGDAVYSTADNKDAFWGVAADRIGRVAIAIREYTAQARSVRKDEFTWGLWYQKWRFERQKAVDSPTWKVNAETKQENPYDLTTSTKISVKYYGGKIPAFSYEDVIPEVQMRSAFTSFEAFGQLISGIYMNISNAMEVAKENLDNTAIATNIALVLKNGKAAQMRDLMYEYNKARGNTGANRVKRLDAMILADFLKYAGREIRTMTKVFPKMSTKYNVEGLDRHTSADKMVVEILEQFASATATYLESDTYHKELVALPRYEEVVYWQGDGVEAPTDNFDEASKIYIKNAAFKLNDDDTDTVQADGVICFIHDVDSASSIMHQEYSWSEINKRDRVTNFGMQAEQEYMVAADENAVVFFMSDNFVELDHHTASVTAAAGASHTASLTATVPAGVTVTWSTSDEEKATVSNGTVTGVAAGTAVITASYKVNGYEYKDVCTVTVS